MKSILFICSPNLGMFDVWLPVIDSLKKKTDMAITVLLPKVGLIDLVDDESVLLEKISALTSRVIFMNRAGAYVAAPSFEAAVKLSDFSRIERALESSMLAARNKVSRSFFVLLQKLWSWTPRFSKKHDTVELAEVVRSVDAVLCDITETRKDYARELFKALAHIPKFSLFHGAEIERHMQPKYHGKNLDTASTHAYLYSNDDREYYQDLGIDDAHIKLTGIPRLKRSWAQSIISESQKKVNLPWDKYVVLISRPVVGPYLPYDRKRRIVENIKKLVFDELRMNLVIKLHPKERGWEMYGDVFKELPYGQRWVFSNLHPFVLSRNSIFGISFYSGVVTDFLIVNQVPCIETLDLRGIKEYDNEKSLRDKKGDPILTTRYNGIVLGGSDYETLRANAHRILNDRQAVVNELTANFKTHYADFDDPGAIIVDDILKVIN